MDNLHKITLIGRNKLNIEGVTDVISFDEKIIAVDTFEGLLLIKGYDLQVSKISLETNELIVSGEVDSLSYNEILQKQNSSIVKKIFK